MGFSVKFDIEIDKYWHVLNLRMSKFVWQLRSEFPDLDVKTYGEDVFAESEVLCHINISSQSCPYHSLRLYRKKINDTNNLLYSLSKNESAIPLIKQLYERATMSEYDEEEK